MRRALAIAASLLAAAAFLYHGYWPRERTGVPVTDGPLASVLRRDDLPYRVWIAHPHQNLGLVTASPEWVAAVDLAVELGLPRLELPSFGPLAAPPARALALATDAGGERVALAAEIYRLPALAARLAGRLAGNPWLAGGRVETGGGAFEVAWEGATWIVTRGTARLGRQPAEGREPTERPSIACLRLSERVGRFPAGTYRLARHERGLELTTGEVETLRPLVGPPAAVTAVLAAASTADRLDALAILSAVGSNDGLPDSLVFHRGAGRRWSLPGEPIYEMLGRDPEVEQHGPWQVAGDGARHSRSSTPLLSYLDQLLVRPTSAAPGSFLWVNLPAARAAVGPLARQLARLPIVEARRFASAAVALEALDSWGSLSVVIVEGAEPAVLARLAP